MNQAELCRSIGQIETKVNDLHKAMFGNGKPGITTRVHDIENHICTCSKAKEKIEKEKKQHKVDIKFIIMAIIAVGAILKDLIH